MTNYKRGDLVCHPDYGSGVVLRNVSSGVECIFNDRVEATMWSIFPEDQLSLFIPESE